MSDSPVKLDQLQLMMIKELETDGRQTITDLAKKLGTSKATARRKLGSLLESKVISVVAISDPRSLGYNTMATIGIDVMPGFVDDVADKLMGNKNVHTIRASAGRFDIDIAVMFRSIEELSKFIRGDLGRIPNIVNVEAMVTLELMKRSFAYLGDDIATTKKRIRRSKKKD